jgi:putative membrane protein
MTPLKTTIAILSTIALATATSACAPNNNEQATNRDQPNATLQSDQTVAQSRSTVSTLDSQFANKAAEAGLAEVQLAQLALQRGSSNDVKEYAQDMVKDHTKANNELKQLAARKGITLPQTLNQQHQTAKANLSKLSGASFDQAYMDLMNQDHAKVVSLFQQQADQGQDPDLKNWANKTLPTLKEHKQMAQSTASAVSK